MSTFGDFMIDHAVKRDEEFHKLRDQKFELLSALEACLGSLQMECGECGGSCTGDPCTQCRAKAAIQKAKGL